MAATRSFTRSAVAAAVFVLLSACGGGDAPEQVQVTAQTVAPAAVVQALTGKAVEARQRILAVSAPTSKSRFSLTADIKLAGATEVRSQKQATTASTSLSLTDQAEKVFDWAEAQPGLKAYFPKPQVSQNACIPEGCFIFRYYPLTPETGNYLGIRTDGPRAGEITLYGQYVSYVITPFARVDDDTFKCIADIDSCRPTVTSTTPQNGAVDVSAKGTVVNFTFNEPINCAGIDGTGEVGSDVKVIVTISCRSSSRTVTITPADNRWPFGIEARLTITGVQNLAGYPSLPVEVTFKTKPVQVTPAYYLGDQARQDGANVIHVISPEGMVTKEVVLPPVPGLNLAHRMLADPLTGQLWVLPWVTMRLYAVDLEDYQVATLDLSPALDTYFLLEGAFINGGDFCTALARSFAAGVWTGQNKLACWNRTTKAQSLLTDKNFLAEETMRTLRIDLVGNKLYLVNGLDTAHDNSNFLWLPGTPGELRVLNPTTLTLERKVKVGSVPVDFVVHPTSGDVWVINGGDKSLSVVHPSGNVETMPMSGLSESAYQRPTNIVMNAGKGQVYVTDGYQNLIVYDVATQREVRRIPLGTVGSSPRTMLLRGNDLYVVLTNRGTVMKVNVDTFAVSTFTTNLGTFPGSLYGVGL